MADGDDVDGVHDVHDVNVNANANAGAGAGADGDDDGDNVSDDHRLIA